MQSLTVNSSSDLDTMIQSYLVQGFMVAHKSDSSVTLTKKKSFNWVIAVAGFVFMFIGLFVYLAYYMTKKDEVVTINVSKAAKVG